MTKKTAIEKYKPIFEAGMTEAELREALTQDDKAFSPEDIDELVKEIVPAVPGAEPEKPKEKEQKPPKANSGTNDQPTTFNKKYEEWSVEAKYKDVTDNLGKVIGRKLDGFDKIKKIRNTAITPERAKELNGQAENTNLYLYEVK